MSAIIILSRRKVASLFHRLTFRPEKVTCPVEIATLFIPTLFLQLLDVARLKQTKTKFAHLFEVFMSH